MVAWFDTTDLAYKTYTLFNSKQNNGNVAHISLETVRPVLETHFEFFPVAE